jgi:glyoxylase-like metal-dependent hydrolase (beta-lactamase superfamily II)
MSRDVTGLTWEVFTSEPIPTLGDEPPPGQSHRIWPPISSTLVMGAEAAVLVDTPITIAQNVALADWVESKGKSLTTVYITHGHGDHWFGLEVLLARFPNARAVAIPAVVEQIRRHSTSDDLDLWRRRFPGQLPGLAIAEELSEPVVELEGNELVPVVLGHTDMDDTTCLHVPSIGLVVAGDAVYNDVYLQLRESNAQTRLEWLAALNTIDSLEPRAVVAGHKRPGRADDPQIVDETRRYIVDFSRVLEEEDTAEGVYHAMTSLYPDRLYPGALWASARELKGAQSSPSVGSQ